MCLFLCLEIGVHSKVIDGKLVYRTHIDGVILGFSPISVEQPPARHKRRYGRWIVQLDPNHALIPKFGGFKRLGLLKCREPKCHARGRYSFLTNRSTYFERCVSLIQ